MRFKKRATEVFSLSFLDCICCGFGAVLLLFVLTAGNRAAIHDTLEARISEVVGNMNSDIALKEKELEELKRSLFTFRKMNMDTSVIVDVKKKNKTTLEEELALLLEQLAIEEEAKDKLIKDKEFIPRVEEKPPIPIPNEKRRQYLTGFNMDGDNILFLVEASGSMLDDEVGLSLARLDDSDDEKREAPKWSRIKKGLQWMIANLKPEVQYKIIFFNNELNHVESEYGSTWYDPSDSDVTNHILKEIEKVVPGEGSNLEMAFDVVGGLEIVPDRIVLMVDGLPTLSNSYDGPSNASERVNMFLAAKRALVNRIPVNTILYPMKNDPGAAVHFWRLCDDKGGALVCPSESWPDI